MLFWKILKTHPPTHPPSPSFVEEVGSIYGYIYKSHLFEKMPVDDLFKKLYLTESSLHFKQLSLFHMLKVILPEENISTAYNLRNIHCFEKN